MLLLAFYLAPWRGALAPRQPPAELLEEPDLHLEQAVIDQYQQDGALHYRLVAQRVLHFKADRHTRLVQPELSLYNPPQPPWRVQARRGYLLGGGMDGGQPETVVLRGDVVLHQTGAGLDSTTIRTAELRLHPAPRQARTDQDVMIETQTGRTSAQGLDADLQGRFLRLKSDADGRVHTRIPPELALAAEAGQPMHLRSAQAEFDQLNGLGVYLGGVAAQQGSLQVTGERLVVHYRNAKAQRIVASGGPARYQQRLQGQGGLVRGSAAAIDYDVGQGRVDLQGGARLLQAGNAVAGERVRYRLASQRVEAAATAGVPVRVSLRPAGSGG